ncbi:MAG: carbon storage regulator [Pirellulales bacterium]|nr:carbon storage regulator [Pirellulales bacterium]
MLVLSRKQQQQIKIGEQITVTILRVTGNTVRVGIQAPREVRVVRGELPKEGAHQQTEGAIAIATETSGLESSGVMEIGTCQLVFGSDETDETSDEVVAGAGGQELPPVVTRAPAVSSRPSTTFRHGPLAHLVAGSAALAK